MSGDRKKLKEEYKRAGREAGVFQIRNEVNGKVFVASALDLPGGINRHRFELTAGGHMNKRLQAEWDEFGAERFAFEVLDQLVPREGPGAEPRAELALLESLWLERLRPFGERGYNEPEVSREERLRRIAAARARENQD